MAPEGVGGVNKVSRMSQQEPSSVWPCSKANKGHISGSGVLKLRDKVPRKVVGLGSLSCLFLPHRAVVSTGKAQNAVGELLYSSLQTNKLLIRESKSQMFLSGVGGDRKWSQRERKILGGFYQEARSSSK